MKVKVKMKKKETKIKRMQLKVKVNKRINRMNEKNQNLNGVGPVVNFKDKVFFPKKIKR